MPSVLTYAHPAHEHTHAYAYSRAHTRANETGGGDDLSASFYDEQMISWCRIFPRRQVCVCWGVPNTFAPDPIAYAILITQRLRGSS
jgi:hypothetical protein